MKKNLLLMLVVLLFSCNKQDIVKVESDNDNLTKLTTRKMSSQMDNTDVMNIEEVFPSNFNPSTLTEAQAETIMIPLLSNGQNLYNGLLQNIIGTSEWDSLTQEDQYSITHLTDQQIVMLYVIYNSAQSDVDWAKTRSCLSGALGLGTLYGLIQNTSALMTVQGTVSVLKLLGKRYLGYIGLALAIWDFLDCIRATPVDEEGGGGEEEIDGLYALDLESYLLPTPFPSPILFTVGAANLTNGQGHEASTTIYFNSSDQKYYSDSNFTTFVPNGYYESPVLMTVYPQVYHIVNGVSVMSYTIQ